MSTKDHLIKSTTIISLSTVVSRILGFVRDMIIARFLGTGMLADAFLASFSIPNMLRHLMGEGVLSAGLVPVFTESIEKDTKQETNLLMSSAFWIVLIISVLITVVLSFFTPLLVKIIVPGFVSDPEKLGLTIKITRWLMPYLIFVGVTSCMISMLHSYKRFFIPAISSAVFNLVIIISSLFFGIFFDKPLMGMITGVLLGGIMQVFIQLPALFKNGFEFKFKLWHPSIKKIIYVVGPAIFALSISEINIAVTRIFASSEALAGKGAISILYFSNRLIQLPMGVFAIAISTAILPTLSSQVVNGEIEKVKMTLSYAFRFALFIVIPAMVGLIVLRVPIIRLLFERGEFGPDATRDTASALLFYSFGILGYVGVKIITPVFYSLKDSTAPAKIALIILCAGVFLDFILVRLMKFAGLALSISFSNFIQLGLLIFFLRKKIGPLGLKKVLKSLVLILLVSLLMGVVCFGIVTILDNYLNFMLLSHKIFQVVVCILAGLISFVSFSYIFKLKEIEIVSEIIREKAGKML